MTRHVDSLIARHITKLGSYDTLPHYSRDLTDTWEVVEALSRSGLGVNVQSWPGGVEVIVFDTNGQVVTHLLETVLNEAETICAAALSPRVREKLV